MKKQFRKTTMLFVVAATMLGFCGCGHNNESDGDNTRAADTEQPTRVVLMTPSELNVSRMPDSLFDGRPHIVADDGFYELSAKQVELLRTFSNPAAPQIIAILNSIDSLMRASHDTITTKEELMQYYRLYDQLDDMTNRLTSEEQSKIARLK